MSWNGWASPLAEAVEPPGRAARPWRNRPLSLSQLEWGRYRSPVMRAEQEIADRPRIFALARAASLDPPPPIACQWIEAELPAVMYCGKPVNQGAFCACHARRAYAGGSAP